LSIQIHLLILLAIKFLAKMAIRSLDNLVLNAAATATSQVIPSDLASNIAHSRDVYFPAVLATANMLSIMEVASARVLTPHLSGTQTSVATRTDVAHSAASPLGAQVTATARFLKLEGKLYKFEVIASDAGGVIGRAHMWRAIVFKERVELNASQRLVRT
jgi:predicted thioesterase